MAPKTLVNSNVQVVTLVAIVLTLVLKTTVGEGEGEVSVNGVKSGISGTLTSPNFPDYYPNEMHEELELETTHLYTIKVFFKFFDLENHEKCQFDYIEFYDRYPGYDRFLGRFCGSDIPRPIKSTTHKMLIVFHTDGSNTRKGFRVAYLSELNFVSEEIVGNLTKYFVDKIHTRTINKGGTEIARTAVALFLKNRHFFDVGMTTGEIIAYDLTLQLMSKLVMKKTISTTDLALFVNAMTVACIDPKNFFGVNIVAELRRHVNNRNQTNPFFILALCIGGDSMKVEDIQKLQQLFGAYLRPSWTDTQAMIIMALKCISRQSETNLNATITEMVLELKRKQQNNVMDENLKISALVIQALIATGSYYNDFNMSMAIKSIVKDMEKTHMGIEEKYHILPIFRLKSLLDINSNHCATTIKTDLEGINNLLEHIDEQIEVQISIIIGDDMDFSRTWKIKVSSNYTFYQVLETISSSDPDYKIRYVISNGKPYVSGLASFQDSTEDGLYWFIFTKPLSSTDDPIFVVESPVDIGVNETIELILWYRSGSSFRNQDVTSDVTVVY